MQNLREYVVSFDDMYEYNGKVYLSSACFNGLITCNPDGKVIRVECFPDIENYSILNHRNIHKFENMLFFTPDHVKGIHKLDLTTNSMRFYPFNNETGVRYRCADSYIWDNKIWLFGALKSNSVICFNPRNNEYKFFDSLLEPIPVENEKSIIFNTKLTYHNEHIYGVKNHSNKIVHINLRQKTTDIITVSDFDNLFGVTYLNKKLYLTMYKSYLVVEYDLITGKEKVIELDKSLSVSQEPLTYSCLAVYDNQVYLVNCQDYYVARIEKDIIKKFCDFPKGYAQLSDLHRKKCRPIYNIKTWDKGIRFFPISANMMISVDIGKRTTCGLKVCVDKEWIDNEYRKTYFEGYLNSSGKDKSPIRENEWAGLEMFLKYLCEDK